MSLTQERVQSLPSCAESSCAAGRKEVGNGGSALGILSVTVRGG